MDCKALISVIIPLYNREKYVAECLKSVVGQTYANLEIIIIDDGSTDRSGEICQEFVTSDNRIKYILQPNAGVSAARNHGLQIATGEWIGWVDSDDYIEADMYETLLGFACDKQCDMVRCEPYMLFSDRCKVRSTYDHTFTDSSDRFIPDILTDKLQSYLPVTLARRKIYKEITFPDGEIFEDTKMMFMIMKRCNKIGYLHHPLYYYRQHEQTICAAMESTIKGKGEYFDALLAQHSFAAEHYPACAKQTLNHIARIALKTIRRYGTSHNETKNMVSFLRDNRTDILLHCPLFDFWHKMELIYITIRY